MVTRAPDGCVPSCIQSSGAYDHYPLKIYLRTLKRPSDLFSSISSFPFGQNLSKLFFPWSLLHLFHLLSSMIFSLYRSVYLALPLSLYIYLTNFQRIGETDAEREHQLICLCVHTEKSFLKNVNLNYIFSVITLFRMIWHQTEFSLVANQSEKSYHNTNLVPLNPSIS